MEKNEKLKTNSNKTIAKSVVKGRNIESKEDPFRWRGSVCRSPPSALTKSGITEQRRELTEEVDDMELETEFGTDVRSRTSSVSSVREDAGLILRGKNRRVITSETEENIILEGSAALKEALTEREQLESFLFNKNNKISKSAIKFILSKWSTIESRLQNEILEKKKLKAVYDECVKKQTKGLYAQVAASSGVVTIDGGARDRFINKDNHEVVLIKPESNDDTRTNEEIRTKVTNIPKNEKSLIKVKGISIRKLHNKGILMEVNSKKDIEIIKQMNLHKYGLTASAPKKYDPSIIIYDVDKDYVIENLKDDFNKKNFNHKQSQEFEKLKSGINFKFCFKSKSTNRVNWIVQLPAVNYGALVKCGRIFLAWRTHRIKKYIGLVRCYKCCDYGHIAKNCSAPKQVCEHCGSMDHDRESCLQKDRPTCVNCIRTRRKDTQHYLRSKACPEFLRHVEMYKHKVKWS